MSVIMNTFAPLPYKRATVELISCEAILISYSRDSTITNINISPEDAQMMIDLKIRFIHVDQISARNLDSNNHLLNDASIKYYCSRNLDSNNHLLNDVSIKYYCSRMRPIIAAKPLIHGISFCLRTKNLPLIPEVLDNLIAHGSYLSSSGVEIKAIFLNELNYFHSDAYNIVETGVFTGDTDEPYNKQQQLVDICADCVQSPSIQLCLRDVQNKSLVLNYGGGERLDNYHLMYNERVITSTEYCAILMVQIVNLLLDSIKHSNPLDYPRRYEITRDHIDGAISDIEFLIEQPDFQRDLAIVNRFNRRPLVTFLHQAKGGNIGNRISLFARTSFTEQKKYWALHIASFI
jgi:hypothetical protein